MLPDFLTTVPMLVTPEEAEFLLTYLYPQTADDKGKSRVIRDIRSKASAALHVLYPELPIGTRDADERWTKHARRSPSLILGTYPETHRGALQ